MGPHAPSLVNRAVPAVAPFVAAQPVPTAATRHLLNRLGCGWSPGDQRRVEAAGGPLAWFAQQLRPATVPEAAKVAEVDSWFGNLRTTPSDRWRAVQSGTSPFTYAVGLANWTILRRVYTQRPVLETMVDFWSDHFNVSSTHGLAWIHRIGFDQTIRLHALGRFSDLLTACTLHPAMQFFLDNWLNVAGNPNENHGRELLELHTVGVEAGYTEAMVKDSAAILSGYTNTWGDPFSSYYSAARHTTGYVNVLDFRSVNASSDGRAVTAAYLSYLAHHPSTARRLARRIAARFVQDVPPPALVARLAKVYLSSGTDIAAVLTELVRSPEFAASAGRKVRRPVDDLVSTAKVLGVQVGAPGSPSDWASVASFMHGGNYLYCWLQPYGPALENAPWCSASRVFASFQMHLSQTSGLFPGGATYRQTADWMPDTTMTLATYVDYLSRRLLGIPADERLTAAGVAAVPYYADTPISASNPPPYWVPWRVIIALLDSPDHMTR